MFITIEGIEGAGKSTVVRSIETYLTKKNISLLMTREPGGTLLAEEMRNILLHPKIDEDITEATELFLMFACRSQHLKHKIIPALNEGKWVVSDRFIDATYAYQGGGRGIDFDFIQQLDQRIVGIYYPHLTFLLDIEPEVGLARAEKRKNNMDRIEQETIDFFIRVREVYLARAKKMSGRIKIIQAHLPLEQVLAPIYQILDKCLEEE